MRPISYILATHSEGKTVEEVGGGEGEEGRKGGGGFIIVGLFPLYSI